MEVPSWENHLFLWVMASMAMLNNQMVVIRKNTWCVVLWLRIKKITSTAVRQTRSFVILTWFYIFLSYSSMISKNSAWGLSGLSQDSDNTTSAITVCLNMFAVSIPFRMGCFLIRRPIAGCEPVVHIGWGARLHQKLKLWLLCGSGVDVGQLYCSWPLENSPLVLF